MIVYFADRRFNILGHASTGLRHGLIVVEDNKIEEIETGIASFECKICFDGATRAKAKELTAPGNYLLRSDGKESKLFSISDREIDTKKQEIYIYAEDDGLDLLNDVVGAYDADKPYPIDHYINKYAAGAGFEIGINEAEGLTRQLSWSGESTASARIASVAPQFGGCEISFSFEVKGLSVVKKYINIYRERGTDNGIQLRLNNEIDNIITTESVANLATALYATGGTPDNSDAPVTLLGYEYDDGDFYIDGDVLKSRTAFAKWNRFILGSQEGGHITKPFTSKATSQAVLCEEAIAQLKKYSDVEVNYEVDITKFPDNVKIGDRVNIVDDAGELYVSARVLKLEQSVADQEHKATLGEYLIKGNGIHQKVAELAEQFAKNSVSVARALAIANNAKTAAANAQEQANSALQSTQAAQQAAQAAQQAANSASESASTAQQKAAEAEQAVGRVEASVAGLETTVANAQAAAQQAQQAAQTAETKASEAQQAAANAKAKADETAEALADTEEKAENAVAKAETAQNAAAQAIADAEEAATTAAAAKLDAEQAKEDIDAFERNLTTLENTMKADYARKTDLTETEAQLQMQIKQNAAGLSSTVSKVQRIDETANDAHKLLQGALALAEKAQEEADQATADAEAAQTAANGAEQAAEDAQAEADTAKEAATTAQTVADNAETALANAKADLATVQSRADATEEEIAAAREAVEAAQTAANTAIADAITANGIAAEAQAKADAVLLEATIAQGIAIDAANNAALAQKVADEAKGNAEAAQAAADEAAEQAAAAQATANTAVENAEAAQATANEAAKQSAAATQAATDAQAKSEQAANGLADAEQRLADVMEKVDATEEEIAAAQRDVDAAQESADAAEAEYATAQAAANEAAANAAAAQTAADNAQTAADEAQAAANEAQQAANNAMVEVYGLAARFENAETKITQNASQIALAATKKAVAKTLGGYSTTEEMNAAINVKADVITSSVNSVKTETDNNKASIAAAESLIQQLANSIASLVRDGNGGTLVKQDANGLWFFDISGIEQNISDTANELDGLSGIVLDANGQIDVLKSTAAALQKRTEYVRSYTDENGQPCLELGEGDSVFKVRITNTEIQFAEGTAVPAKLNRKMLVIEKAMVKDELQFGDDEVVDGVWIWKRRANGNLGLSWKAVVR